MRGFDAFISFTVLWYWFCLQLAHLVRHVQTSDRSLVATDWQLQSLHFHRRIMQEDRDMVHGSAAARGRMTRRHPAAIAGSHRGRRCPK
jgi:hypothetical protein